MSYDTKCRDLALDWLEAASDTKPRLRDVDSLAQAIQDAIEQWQRDREDEAEAARDEYWDRKLHKAAGK